MNKTAVGLPPNYSIKVSEPAVQLADYLDESPVQQKKIQAENFGSVPAAAQVENPELINQQENESPSKPTVKKIRRRQINMSPTTQKKFAEIIEYVQNYGPQPDTAASEIMDAIISIHYDALQNLRFGSIQPRGRWGTPTADAFKHSLSQAFSIALLKSQSP